jgi:hypothetical protein
VKNQSEGRDEGSKIQVLALDVTSLIYFHHKVHNYLRLGVNFQDESRFTIVPRYLTFQSSFFTRSISQEM